MVDAIVIIGCFVIILLVGLWSTAQGQGRIRQRVLVSGQKHTIHLYRAQLVC